MIKRLFSLAAMALLVASCTNDVDNVNRFNLRALKDAEFYATIVDGSDSETKVFADSQMRVLWNAVDQISVFNKDTYNQPYQFKGEDGDNSGGFRKINVDEEFDTANSIDHIYSIYPYQSTTKISNDGEISVALPSQQYYKQNSFGIGANTMMSVTDDNHLKFRNVGSYLSLKLYGESVFVKSITLKGNNHEKLAGAAKVTMPLDGTPTVEMQDDATESITLICEVPVALGSTADDYVEFWFVVPPTTFSNGFSVTVTDSQDGTFEKSSSKELFLTRNALSRMASLEVVITPHDPDDPPTAPEGGKESGLYLGISSFDRVLKYYPVHLMTDESLEDYKAIVDGMDLATQNGTLLYYSIDEDITSIQKVTLPDDLFSVCLVTFTDGLDQGSLAKRRELYDDDMEYLEAIHTRMETEQVSGLPIKSYAIGLKGTDAQQNPSLFQTNLEKIASTPQSSSEKYVYTASNMTEVNSAFEKIAKEVSRRFTFQKLEITIPFPSGNGTRERFVLDNKSATYSTRYIEGVFDMSTLSLKDIQYVGITTTSASVVPSVLSDDEIELTFTFEGIQVPDGDPIETSYIHHYSMRPTESSWQLNSEFSNTDDCKSYNEVKTALVLLNIDLSKSLSGQLGNLKTSVKSFISKLYDNSTDPNVVKSVKLDKDKLELYVGQSGQLTATVMPAKVIEKGVTWSSSNPSVATVDANGLVRARQEGSTVITATTVIGGKTAYCTVSVKPVSEELAVDLGLSVKWAPFNVGAGDPEEYGDYFAWGETEPKSFYDWTNYKWCNGKYNTLTKYCTSSSYGTVDGKTTLDSEDDAVITSWGGKWRIPTLNEANELINNCTWTDETQNGINGSRITGPNGKSIFIPWSGQHDESGLQHVNKSLIVWLNQCNGKEYGYTLCKKKTQQTTNHRHDGLCIRAVYGVPISVSEVQLSKTELSLKVGGCEQLTATVLPENASEKGVNWSSSMPSVASVDANGLIIAKQSGTTVVTVTTVDGGKTAQCTVTVSAASPPEAIDLGLSVRWATFNVGASSPEEYGNYYAWGETTPKSYYDWTTYNWCKGSSHTLTKYNNNSNYGTVDNLTTLQLADDAAQANWGGKWRMPTDAEWTELRTYCDWTWTTQDGVNGYVIKSKTNGNSIFLPAAGSRHLESLDDVGTLGLYWSSSLIEDEPSSTWYSYFSPGTVCGGYGIRSYGFTVRPVFPGDAAIPIEDKNLKAYLVKYCDTDWDDEISVQEARKVTSLSFNTDNISSLKGLEYFTNLTSISCRGSEPRSGKLTFIDVLYGLTQLESIDCSNNQVVTLDFSGFVYLRGLSCSGNKITALDISKNFCLQKLDCQDNQLTALDASVLYAPPIGSNSSSIVLNCLQNPLTVLYIWKGNDPKRIRHPESAGIVEVDPDSEKVGGVLFVESLDFQQFLKETVIHVDFSTPDSIKFLKSCMDFAAVRELIAPFDPDYETQEKGYFKYWRGKNSITGENLWGSVKFTELEITMLREHRYDYSIDESGEQLNVGGFQNIARQLFNSVIADLFNNRDYWADHSILDDRQMLFNADDFNAYCGRFRFVDNPPRVEYRY